MGRRVEGECPAGCGAGRPRRKGRGRATVCAPPSRSLSRHRPTGPSTNLRLPSDGSTDAPSVRGPLPPGSPCTVCVQGLPCPTRTPAPQSGTRQAIAGAPRRGAHSTYGRRRLRSTPREESRSLGCNPGCPCARADTADGREPVNGFIPTLLYGRSPGFRTQIQPSVRALSARAGPGGAIARPLRKSWAASTQIAASSAS